MNSKVKAFVAFLLITLLCAGLILPFGGDIMVASSASGNTCIIRSLVSIGVSVNSSDSKLDLPPLLSAVENHQYQAAMLLIECGANVDYVNKEHQCALLSATSGRDTKMVSLLLSKNPKLEVADKYGDTPLMIAVLNNDVKIVEMLIAHGAKIDTRFGAIPFTNVGGKLPREVAEEMKYSQITKMLGQH